GQLTPVGERLTGAGDPAALAELADPAAYQPVMDLVSIPQLMEIFSDIMRRMSDKIDTVRAGYGEMPKEKFTITEKISFIKNALHDQENFALSALFEQCNSRHEMIVTFLALLEAMRLGFVHARQKRTFEDITLSRG
ncbi:MAG: hypothetical protein FWF80_08085, partial [Defluviitaleaceae bacterium]|nr:hypothetical protein [Defluviitaleaceae bacterium]